MADPSMMESLKMAAIDLTGDMMPAEMWDDMEVMADSLGVFMADPTNMDALLPFLEKVEDVGMNVDTMQGNVLNSMGFNSSEELLSVMRAEYVAANSKKQNKD